jgi:hypothetical protein
MTQQTKNKPKRRYAREKSKAAVAAAQVPTAKTSAPAPEVGSAAGPRDTKIAQVTALLLREDGATLEELITATGWLPHTTRAALTGLRKKGHTVDKSKRGKATCYRIAASATA